MFELNFISEPGIQNKNSDASWSFLYKRSETDKNGESNSKQFQTFSTKQNRWKKSVFIPIIIGFIAIILILNIRYTKSVPDVVVLNQVIDLINESGYLKNLQLEEANFSMNLVKVTIRSEDFNAIQSLSHSHRIENEIPYEIYKKGKYSYLHFIFPWEGKEKGGDITILQSMANKTVFSNKTSIKHTEDIFEIQGESSDIISFLLQMAANEQIQKYNFSVFHNDSDQFNLVVQLNLI